MDLAGAGNAAPYAPAIFSWLRRGFLVGFGRVDARQRIEPRHNFRTPPPD